MIKQLLLWCCLERLVIKSQLLRMSLFGVLSSFILLIDPFAVNSEPIQLGVGIIMEQKGAIIEVPYVTLRNRTDSTNLSEYFGGERGELSAGICTVSFSPIWGLNEISESVPFYIPDETIELSALKEIEMDYLFSAIDKFPKKDIGNIVIYIHGYNTDFEKSCRRSALFQRALGLNNRLLFFSWPAEGNMLKYTWDEADLEWSVTYIAQFIEEVVKRAGNKKVDVVAHSLGARGAMQALARLTYNKPKSAILNELVLIAPDIDTDVFRQELPAIKNAVNRVTVYVSKNDKALKLSQEVHGYPRLGEAGDNLKVFAGVETIDISELNSRRVSGHLYHLFNPEVIEDLTQLLHTGEAASLRPLLKTVSHDDLPYWQMVSP